MLIRSYIYIPVSDLEKSADWYEKNFEFNVIYKESLYFDMRTDNGIIIMLIPSEKKLLRKCNIQQGSNLLTDFVLMILILLEKIRDEWCKNRRSI